MTSKGCHVYEFGDGKRLIIYNYWYMQWTSSSPPQDPAEQGSVQALRRRKASLHLRYCDFVLWRWAEKRQTTRNRTEHFVWVYHTSEKPVFIYRYGRDIAVVLGYGNRTLTKKEKKTWFGPPIRDYSTNQMEKDELLCSRQPLSKIRHMRLYAHHLARLCGIKGSMVLSERKENRYHSNSFSFSSWM